MANQSEHDWVRRRLLAQAAGLLDDADQARFEHHLAQCAECRTVFSTYADGQGTREWSEGHIPSAMIVHWKTADRTLRGVERALVEQHLHDCPDCRQDLELLGFEPSVAGESQTAPRSEKAFSQIGRRAWRQTRWHKWALGGWAAVATAAMLALVIIPSARDNRTQREPGHGIILPWVAPDLVRGGSEVQNLTVSPGTRRILLAIRVPPNTSNNRAARVIVRSPDEAVLLRTEVVGAALDRGTIMLTLESAEPLQPGTYQIEFSRTGAANSASEPVVTFFTLRYPTP